MCAQEIFEASLNLNFSFFATKASVYHLKPMLFSNYCAELYHKQIFSDDIHE